MQTKLVRLVPSPSFASNSTAVIRHKKKARQESPMFWIPLAGFLCFWITVS